MWRSDSPMSMIHSRHGGHEGKKGMRSSRGRGFLVLWIELKFPRTRKNETPEILIEGAEDGDWIWRSPRDQGQHRRQLTDSGA